MAITKFDQFDFLIDIVPREDIKPAKRQVSGRVVYSCDVFIVNFQNISSWMLLHRCICLLLCSYMC